MFQSAQRARVVTTVVASSAHTTPSARTISTADVTSTPIPRLCVPSKELTVRANTDVSRAFIVGPVPDNWIFRTVTPVCSATSYQQIPVRLTRLTHATLDPNQCPIIHAEEILHTVNDLSGQIDLKALYRQGAPVTINDVQVTIPEVSSVSTKDTQSQLTTLETANNILSNASYLIYASNRSDSRSAPVILAGYVSLSVPSHNILALRHLHICPEFQTQSFLRETLQFIAFQHSQSVSDPCTFTTDLVIAIKNIPLTSEYSDEPDTAITTWNFRGANAPLLLLTNLGFRPQRRVAIHPGSCPSLSHGDVGVRWALSTTTRAFQGIEIERPSVYTHASASPLMQHCSHTVPDEHTMTACGICQGNLVELIDRRTRAEILQAMDLLINVCWKRTETPRRLAAMKQLHYYDTLDPLRYRPILLERLSAQQHPPLQWNKDGHW